jgi:hypothetical protein
MKRLVFGIGVGLAVAALLATTGFDTSIRRATNSVLAGLNVTGGLTTDTLTATGAVSGSNLSGTNTGDESVVAPITESSHVISINMADLTDAGAVTTLSQSFNGDKKFAGTIYAIPDGGVGSGIRWNQDSAETGFYRPAATSVGVAINGTQGVLINISGLYVDGGVLQTVGAGTTAADMILSAGWLGMNAGGAANTYLCWNGAACSKYTQYNGTSWNFVGSGGLLQIGTKTVPMAPDTRQYMIEANADAGTAGVLNVTFTTAFTNVPSCVCSDQQAVPLVCGVTAVTTAGAAFAAVGGGTERIHWNCTGVK